MTYSIKAEKRWKVWCFKVVQHVNKLCAVYSIAGCKHTSGKHTKLKKLCDGFTFGRFWNTKINRQITLSNSAVQKLQGEFGVQASALIQGNLTVWTTYSLEATSLSHASVTPLLSGCVPLVVLILLSIFQIKENIFLSPSSSCLQAEKQNDCNKRQPV